MSTDKRARLICPSCGHTNQIWRTHCLKCRHSLREAEQTLIDQGGQPVQSTKAPIAPVQEQDSTDEGHVLKCLICETTNATSRVQCRKCGSLLANNSISIPKPKEFSSYPSISKTSHHGQSYPKERPGWIKVYAAFGAIGGILVILLALSMDASSYYGYNSTLQALRILTIVGALPSLAVSYGLWSYKNWARIGNIVLIVIGTGLTACNIFSALSNPHYFRRNFGMLLGYGVGIVVGLLIANWFYKNPEYFE